MGQVLIINHRNMGCTLVNELVKSILKAYKQELVPLQLRILFLVLGHNLVWEKGSKPVFQSVHFFQRSVTQLLL